MRNRALKLGLVAAVAAAVAVPLLVLSSGGVGLTGVAGAATRTQDAGSAKFVVNVQQQAGETGASLTLSGHVSGAIDFRTPAATMTYSVSPGDMSGQMILDGTVWYVKMPALTGLAGGKQWLKLDVTKSGGRGQQALAVLKLVDPARLFGLLGTAGTFTAAGHETVGGVETTHYTGSIDGAKFAAAIGAPHEARDHEQATFSADAWVDGQGYLRRLAFALPTTAASPALKVTVDFSDFGTTVDVTPPPADQVADFDTLAKSRVGGTGTGSGVWVVGDKHESARVVVFTSPGGGK